MVKLELVSGGPAQNVRDEQKPQRTRYKLMTSNATIDYERTQSIAIELVCSDRGDEQPASGRNAQRSSVDGSSARGADSGIAGARPSKQETRLEIELEVLPENEFAPQFSSREYAFDMRENSSYNGMAIGSIAAYDNDSGDALNFTIEKSLSPGGGEQFYLKYHQSNPHEWMVELHLNGTVDREVDLSDPTAERTFRFRVFATDISPEDGAVSVRNQQEHTVWTQVVVRVTDVNDWVPQYVGDNVFHVAEGRDRGLVGALRAFDPDAGKFGQVTFELLDPNSKFALAQYTSLDSTTLTSDDSAAAPKAHGQSQAQSSALVVTHSERGVSRASLVLRSALDREMHGDRVQLALRVTDGGSLSSTATLTVSILDLNDNAPVWHAPPPTCAGSSYSSSFGAGLGVGCAPGTSSSSSSSRVPTIVLNVSSEMAPGVVLYRLNATDRDAGVNGQVLYSMVSSQGAAGFLVLDCQTGELILKRTLQKESLGALHCALHYILL